MCAILGCGAPTKKSGEFVMVVKGCSPGGCNWWDRFEIGVNDASAATGLKASMVHFDTTGLSSGDPKIAEGQAQLVDDLVARKVDVIGIDPDDLAALEPHLEKARAAGIKVVAHEVPGMVNKDWDTETIDNTKFGEDAGKALATAMGSSGYYVAFVGGAPLHATWANNAITYIKNNYPNMQLIQLDGKDLSVCGETAYVKDATAGTDCGNGALKAALSGTNPPTGALGFGSNAGPAAASYLKDNHISTVSVVGVTGPATFAALNPPFAQAFLWDPRDSGLSVVYIANQLFTGADMTKLTIPDLGTAVVDSQSKVVTYNRTLAINPSNAAMLVDSLKLGF